MTSHVDRVTVRRGRRTVESASALSRSTALLAIVCAGCASPGGVIRLEVEYEEGWGLDALEVSSGPRLSGRSAAVHEIVIRAPPRWIDEEVELLVSGLRGESRYAAGRVRVTARADEEARASVQLTLLPCGDWCTPMATQCGAGAVVRCAQRDEDVCLEWGSPEACPTDAPECSLGECRRNCFDECAPGDRECAGPRAFRICAQVDADPCFDWQPTSECAVGETCSAGTCREGCTDECTAGEVGCRAGGVVSCGDLDFDGCLEWGPVDPCATGESCEGGACVVNELCMPECAGSECDEETFRSCGNYDFDSCLELSAGVSCIPTDPCREGRCTDTGCASTTSTCMDPPASACEDDVLTAYDAIGACVEGVCQYRSAERACPGCVCDACAGVACTTPIGECFEPVGTCESGMCVYPLRDGAGCDDGDPCTESDSCSGGTCAGAPMRCEAPPSPCYAPTGVCHGGACTYAFLDDAPCDHDEDPTSPPIGECRSGVCDGPRGDTLSAGGAHTCARRADRTLWCWGANAEGALGDGTTVGRMLATPVVGLLPSEVASTTAGWAHTCSVALSGEAVCWGRNANGQIGDGSFITPRTTPTRVLGLTGVAEIESGQEHTCALLGTRTVACWGLNGLGQLGDGTPETRSAPVAVIGLIDVAEIAVGGTHGCARRYDGDVFCWGANSTGQLGDGTREARSTPMLVRGLPSAVEIATGTEHSCARLLDGSVWCWGGNAWGQLGVEPLPPLSSAIPVAVPGLSDVVELDLGDAHTCARLASGAVACWGINRVGELGNGSRTTSSTPVLVDGLVDAVAIAAGAHHTCALRASGEIACWGLNLDGQLGDGTNEIRDTPVTVRFP